jgi:hypothetical protein
MMSRWSGIARDNMGEMTERELPRGQSTFLEVGVAPRTDRLTHPHLSTLTFGDAAPLALGSDALSHPHQHLEPWSYLP